MIYFNCLGKWEALSETEDNINGGMPLDMFDAFFAYAQEEEDKNTFYKIRHNNVDYFVHASQIIKVEK